MYLIYQIYEKEFVERWYLGEWNHRKVKNK